MKIGGTIATRKPAAAITKPKDNVRENNVRRPVTSDRGAAYGPAATSACPGATRVADRWHLVENASAAFLDAVHRSRRWRIFGRKARADGCGCTKKAASITRCRAIMRAARLHRRRRHSRGPQGLAVPHQPTNSATVLTEQPMAQADTWRLIRRRAAAGIMAPIGNHTFRATGITAYLGNGGALEHAQTMAAHESPRTTKLYDRTQDRLTQDATPLTCGDGGLWTKCTADVSRQTADPSVSGQRPVPPRQAGSGLAGALRLPDQASLLSRLRSTSGPNRAAAGLMHRNITRNKCYEKFADFKSAILTFLREEAPRNWGIYCDDVSDNFRIISPKDFRILA
jgi:hypothetical protein